MCERYFRSRRADDMRETAGWPPQNDYPGSEGIECRRRICYLVLYGQLGRHQSPGEQVVPDHRGCGGHSSEEDNMRTLIMRAVFILDLGAHYERETSEHLQGIARVLR